MLSKKIIIVNQLGLHARAAMKLVNMARRYESEIIIRYQGQEVNAKSIMNVMILAASFGSVIELIVSGNDEAEALSKIEELFNDKFGEEK